MGHLCHRRICCSKWHEREIDNWRAKAYHARMKVAVYVLLCLIWGSTWTGIKMGLEDAPPIWSAAIRFILATALLWLFNLISKRQYPSGWRNKWRVAWPGIFTFFGSYTLTYLGENYITSALAAILFAVMPFFIMGLMPLMLKSERVDRRSVVGVLVAFVGVVMIFSEPTEAGSNSLLGMILLLLSPICAAIGAVTVKAYLHDEPVFPMVTLQMGLGALLLTVTALIFEPLSGFKFTKTSVGAIVYLAVFGSVIAFSGYYWLLQRVRLITMSMVALITPAVAMFVGFILLKEVLTIGDYTGAVLVLVGVLIVDLKLAQTTSSA